MVILREEVQILIDGEPLEQVVEYKYLDEPISSSCSWQREIQNTIQTVSCHT